MPIELTKNQIFYQKNKKTMKKYYLKRSEYLHTKIECETCKCKVSRGNIKQHQKSMKHQKHLKN